MAAWLAAANNARALGDSSCVVDGARLVHLIEVTFFLQLSPKHEIGCYCEACVMAWEKTADEVAGYAKHYGVDLKKHSFGAIRKAANEI